MPCQPARNSGSVYGSKFPFYLHNNSMREIILKDYAYNLKNIFWKVNPVPLVTRDFLRTAL